MGADHAGFPLEGGPEAFLAAEGHEVHRLSARTRRSRSTTRRSARPPPAPSADGRADRGIVLGGSGQGEQIAANKVHGIRAALCHDLYPARLSREHNDANVLGMGARVIAPTYAKEIVRVWLATPFEGGRHVARIEQIADDRARGAVT